MDVEKEIYDELYYAVTGKETMRIQKLMKQRINIGKYYGDEGNIVDVAITKAGSEQLTALLEVDHHQISNKATLSSDKYRLINEPCNDMHQTPLMKSALSGKADAVAILLHYGADVNASVKGSGMRAIDYALSKEHSSTNQIVLLLLKSDSLFPVKESGRLKLMVLMKMSEKIRTFFSSRDFLHAKMKEKPFDIDIKTLLDKEPSSYYLNSSGQSALKESAWNFKFDTWAYLKYRRARDTGDEEKEYINIALESQKESFSRALAKYYFKVRGTQVMKMVSKSRILREDDSPKGMGEEIEGYFKFLNANEITSALLRILHDEIDFEVIFDVSSSDVSQMAAVSGEKVRGLTEYSQNRVYIGTKLSSDYEKGDMLGTLAHELAHKAMAVVFRNNGKPYGEENDGARKESYMKVYSLLQERVWSKNVDDILGRVNTRNYPSSALEEELIVRVPHMIAKYGERDDVDGLTLLQDQFPELLHYYNQWVMPAFKETISASCTNYRMTVKDMSDFHRCLKLNVDDKICISSNVVNFKEKLHHHNGLGILKVSNMHLGLSHLKAQLEEEITYGGDDSRLEGNCREPLFLTWQQFKYQWLNVMKALSNRAVSTLVISWNVEKPPIFCRRNRGCHPSCIYQEIVKDWVEEQKSIVDYDKISENIIIVLSMEPPSLKEVEPLNYFWNDLSDKTKDFILSKQLLFQGKKTNVRKIISVAAANSNIEAYMATSLSPLEISYLLEENKISIGEEPGWSSEEKIYKNVFYHKDYYIKRSFGHRIVCKEAFTKSLTQSDIFFVRNASTKDLVSVGVKEELVSIWNSSNIDCKTRIYLSNKSTDPLDTKDILDRFHSHSIAIHFVTFNAPYYTYDWSFGSVENVTDDIVDVTQFHNRKNIHSHSRLYHLHMDDASENTHHFSLTEEQFIQQEIIEDCGVCPKSIDGTLQPTIIADSSGTGKSFVMNNIATRLKKKHPYAWVISTNLNFHSNACSRPGLDGLKNVKGDAVNILFGMACTRGTSLEMKLFQNFARRKGGIIALFDGFDEICPNYKYEVINYLRELSKLSTIKICITTRLSEKYDLQKSLNCVAFRLVPFKITKQKEFLNLYWNSCLKNYPSDIKPKKIQYICDGLTQFSKINSKVDVDHVINKLNAIAEPEGENAASMATKHEMIDFEKFSDAMIKKISSQHKDKERFTEIPLHVFMVATVVFEDNFMVAENWNLSQLYEQFLHIKMKIFDKEKAMSTESVAAGRSAEMAKKTAYKILEKLSANVFIQPPPYACSREEMEDAVRVGLVKDVMGSDQFLHRSFTEFLFAKWVIRKAKKKNVTLFWLQKLFFDSSLSGVWWFLECLLELQSEAKVNFKTSVLPGEDLWRNINACLYVIIGVTFPSILHLFVNEFGVEVVKLLLKENNFPNNTAYPYGISGYEWFTYPIKTLMDGPLRSDRKFNAFQLIVNIRCCFGIEDIATDKVREMTKTLLQLVGENDLALDLSQMLNNKTWDVFIPQEFFCQINCLHGYLSEVVNFLIGEHREIFRDKLQQVLIHRTEIWHYLDAKNFMTMDVLASSILQEHEFVKLILKKRDFVWFWNRILKDCDLDVIKETWSLLSNKMKRDERIQFLCVGVETQWENRLYSALCNANEDTWPYMWSLAYSYLSTEECKKMIYSAVHPEFSHFTSDALPHCYQFLTMLIATSYLNETEIVDLLIPKMESPRDVNSFLEYICTSDNTRRIFHLCQFLSGKLMGATEDLFSKISSLPYLWSIMHSLLTDMWTSEFSEQMMTLVDRYDVIVDSASGSPLVDLEERQCEKETNPLKFCIVMFHDFLEMGRNHLHSSDLIKLLQLPDFGNESSHYFAPFTELALMLPSILHIIQVLDSPFIFGLLSTILLNIITWKEMKTLLFAVNTNGDTAYHIACRSHHQLMTKLQKLATESIGENGLQELLQVRNKQGFFAEDLLHNADNSGGFTTSYDV